MTTESPMTARPGWPVHREFCQLGDAVVEATVTSVKGYPWLIRRCGLCGEVALSRGGAS